MLAIRDFLLSILGGTEMMWDVALGVLIAAFIVGLLLVLLEIATS